MLHQFLSVSFYAERQTHPNAIVFIAFKTIPCFVASQACRVITMHLYL